MTDDDRLDENEDLALRQLRSVWVSMRDEEPSDRGLAALMSAAREKANELKPRVSWWSRTWDLLRKPPALAFATVVVLVGGAAVISQQRAKDDQRVVSSESDASASSAPGAPGPTPDKPALDSKPDEAVAHGEGAAESGAVAQATANRPPPPPPASPVEPSKPKPKPMRYAPSGAVASGGDSDGRRLFDSAVKPKDAVSPPAEDPVAKAEPAPAPVIAETTTAQRPPNVATLSIATDGETDVQAKGTERVETKEEKRPVQRQPLPSIEGEDRQNQASTVGQLVKQCELAAAKNDCATVRMLAPKIQKQDPALYKSRIAKNAAITKCLTN